MKRNVLIASFVLSALLFGCAKNLTLVVKAENGKVEVLENDIPITDLSKIKAGTVLTLKAIANDGYEFDVWSGDLAGTEISVPLLMDKNKTVEALFAKFYFLTFDANGGTGTMDTQKIAERKSANLTTNGFTKQDNVFVGWSTTETGAVEYTERAKYTIGSVDIKLYAVWENLVDILKFINVPIPEGGLTFPVGEYDDKIATVKKPFFIAETEVTYKLWKIVYNWAINNGYTFANPGKMGGFTEGGEKTELHPATMINFRDSVIFCNALTECFNSTQSTATQIECVYYTDANYITPLRVSTSSTTVTRLTLGSEDCPYIKAKITGNADMVYCSATGFRLPTHAEWECAARWQGTTALNSNYVNPNPVDCTPGYFWTKGNSASGATANFYDDVATKAVAVYYKNREDLTAEVKSKLPNGLGLYDMSGNIWEWNYDWDLTLGDLRIICGLYWLDGNNRALVGYYNCRSPYYATNDCGTGLRLARN